jgi:magnesium transporter
VPLAIFFAKKYNTVVTVRTDILGYVSFKGVHEELLSKSSIINKNLDASYLVFMLIDAAVDNVSPLIQMYGNALEALEFIFDMYTPTTKRNRMSKKLQKDLWILRRWAWAIKSVAQDIQEDSFDVLYPDQAVPFHILEEECTAASEMTEAFIQKADGLEQSWASYQDGNSNNILYNLTMFTMIMLPPQFLTGIYGMNFGKMF